MIDPEHEVQNKLLKSLTTDDVSCFSQLLKEDETLILLLDSTGRTILHLIACLGSDKCFEFLMDFLKNQLEEEKLLKILRDFFFSSSSSSSSETDSYDDGFSSSSSSEFEELKTFTRNRSGPNTSLVPPTSPRNNTTPYHYHKKISPSPSQSSSLDENSSTKPTRKEIILKFVNRTDFNESTALHQAIYVGSQKIAESLIKYGADISIKDLNGDTALHVARIKEDDITSFILIQHGADVSICYSHQKKSVSTESINLYSQADRYGFLPEETRFLTTPIQKKTPTKESFRSVKWAKMIKKWDYYSIKQKKKLRRRISKGIPDCVRGVSWNLILFGATYKPDPRIYPELTERSSPFVEQIDLDVNRESRHHLMFRERYGPGQSSLFRVLKAYSNFDPKVGYCQGMSVIASLLLMYLPEERAFWALVEMNHSPKFAMNGLFDEGFPRLHSFFKIQDKLLYKFFPSLYQHFAELGIAASLYCTEWYMTNFIGSLPYETTLHIWDLFLYFGWEISFAVALGIFSVASEDLKKLDFESTLRYLKQLSRESSKLTSTTEFVENVMELYKKKIIPLNLSEWLEETK